MEAGKNKILKPKASILKTKAVHKPQARPSGRQRDFSLFRKSTRLLGGAFLKFVYLSFGLLIISLLFVTGYEFLQQTPYLKVQKMEISGIDEQHKEELLEAVGLNHPVSLLSFNLDHAKKLMESHPWVRSVDLEKRYPNTLVVQAEEHKIKALVFNGTFHYVNQYGEVFKEAGPRDPLDFPTITGLGADQSRNREILQGAIGVLDVLALEKSPWSVRELSEIHLQTDGRYVLYFAGLPLMIEVQGHELAVKLDGLKKVVQHLKNTGQIDLVRKIDLNYIDGVVVSYRKSKQINSKKG